MSGYIVVTPKGEVILDAGYFAPRALYFTSKERAEKWMTGAGAAWGSDLAAIPLVTVKVR